MCGGRHDPNREQLHRELGQLASAHRDRRIVVVSGGATRYRPPRLHLGLAPPASHRRIPCPPIGLGTLWPQRWAST